MRDYNLLKEKYSHLFEERFWGFDCNDGWYDLLDEMLSKIQHYQIKIVQIKEKFAQLRVYTEHIDEEVEKIIEIYEDRSIKTCEICGKRGEIRNTGWIRTLCNSCYAKKHFPHKMSFRFHVRKMYCICG